jgi:PAS domain S-box-containing protein
VGKKDGIVRWVHAKGRGIFDQSGRCVRVIGTAIDITRQKETAEALRRSEETLRLATDSAEIGLWDMDVINNRNHPDARVKAMFGLSPEAEAEPADYFAQVHPDDVENVLAQYGSAFDSEKRAVYDVEYRALGKDGITRWIAAKGRGIFDQGGKCVRVIGTAIDVTERKQAEQQIRELNETLERRVAEREVQIRAAEQALQQAHKMEAIGNLTGGIAHDFNNLLQGVAGSLDLIRRKPQDVERVRHWAEAGLQAAERGAKLTAQLLAFSRAQQLEMKAVDLPSLLLGTQELLDRTLGPGVRLRFDLDADANAVMGDETQLELAVLNLAINARDATPEGGDLIIATRKCTAGETGLPPGDYVELSVTDTGTGMPPDIVARAFDPFFTTKGVGKGTGLGLSQVYGMARQAGGAARIKSEPGRGTTVSIFLRLTEGNAQRSTAQPEHMESPALSGTILVIDDDQDVRRFLADSLDQLGYAVLEADGGAAGLELLGRSSPDLVILDYAMPGITGAAVAQKIRALRPQLPIVFASGYADTSALDHGAQDAPMLRKPFRVSELHDAIRTALQR